MTARQRPDGHTPSPRLPKAANLLADVLRRQVLLERLAPGTPLPTEAELIAQTGFSRGVVRESVRLLEAEGLVSVRRGRRGGLAVASPDTTTVSKSLALLIALSEATLEELFVFRKLLEPAAAALCAQNATPEQHEQLLASTTVASTETVRHNVDFHIAIADATNNEFFRVVLRAVHELTHWHSSEEDLGADRLEDAARAHARIAQYIVRGQAEQAERAMRRHLTAFEQIMRDAGRLDAPVIPPSRWRGEPGIANIRLNVGDTHRETDGD